MVTTWIRRAIVGAACAVIAAAVFVNAVPRATVAAVPIPSLPQMAGGIHTIKHVIVVMQENRSFDNYFGTFPGADGIPRAGSDDRPPVSRIRASDTAFVRSTTST